MCYEFSEWSWKLHSADLARKERKAVSPEKKQGEPVAPAQPVTPETSIEDYGSIPA